MYIKKEIKKTKCPVFFKRHRSAINISSGLRDAIYPRSHVSYRVEGDFFIISPSKDETDYKLAFSPTGQAKLCVCRVLQYIEILEKRRYDLHHTEGDDFYFLIKNDR